MIQVLKLIQVGTWPLENEKMDLILIGPGETEEMLEMPSESISVDLPLMRLTTLVWALDITSGKILALSLSHLQPTR